MMLRIKQLIKQIIGWPPSPLMGAVIALGFELRVKLTTMLRPRAASVIRKYQGPVRLNLGCGEDLRQGWINIDLTPPRTIRNNNSCFVPLDLRSGLPLDDNTCTYIYSSHFWEHLAVEEGLRLIDDCYRCLMPGGTFRIVLPDFARAFEAYAQHDIQFFSLIPQESIRVAPDLITIADYLQYFIYQYGEHKRFYDREKLYKLLESTGYQKVIESSFQVDVDIDTPLRRAYSFYMEAEK